MKVVSNVTFMRAIVSLEDAMGTTSRMALFCKTPAWRDSPTAISTGRPTEGVRLQPSGGNGFIHTPHRCPPTEAAHPFGRATKIMKTQQRFGLMSGYSTAQSMACKLRSTNAGFTLARTA